MQAPLITAGPSAAVQAAELRALIPDGASVTDAVATILADVRRAGDAAVRRYTEQFDTRGAVAPPLLVTAAERDAAVRTLDPAVRTAIEAAAHNVGAVAATGAHEPVTTEFGTHSVVSREAPVRSAAVYVPGGRAPYPSTVVMGVVTARAAGVQRVAVASPPGPDGQLNPAIIAAAELTGASEVYRMGGAQAVAALAYGTDTIAPVDVIVGPGNLYVQEAKRQLSAVVGLDSFAGPSDLLVLASEGTDPESTALDLLAQGEHGPGTLVVAASSSEPLLRELQQRVESRLSETKAVCRLVLIPDLDYGLTLAEEFAPEHLELLGPQAEQLTPRITRSGCVFVGTGTAFGDYIAGSNHTLPTAGAARFASVLSARHFRRLLSEVRIPDPAPLAKTAAPLARTEGFELHAQSMETRIREN